MTSTTKLLPAVALTAIAFLTPVNAFAGSISDSYLELGAGYTRFDTGSSTLDLVTGKIIGNIAVFDFGPFGFDVRADYSYSGNTDSHYDAYLQEAHAELLFYANVVGILKPYVSAGGAFAGVKFPDGSGGETDYNKGGYTLTAGVQIGVLPDLLYITPSYRYTNAGDWEGNVYQLDLTLWLTYVGLGLEASYQDLAHNDANVVQVVAYVAFRF